MLGVAALSLAGCRARDPDAARIFTDLESPDSAVRTAAERELPGLWRRIGRAAPAELEESYLPVLEAALLRRSGEARYYGAVGLYLAALQNNRDAALSERLSTLVAPATADPDPRVREQVAMLLAVPEPRPPAAAREPLLRLIADPEAKVAQTALVALGRIRPVEPGVVQGVVEVARLREDAAVTAAALRSLGEMEHPGEVAIATLIASLAAEEQAVREAAIAALGRIGPGAALAAEALDAVRMSDSQEELRRLAEGALTRIRSAAVDEGTWSRLGSADPAARREAAAILSMAAIPDLEARLPALRRAIADPDADVRRLSLVALYRSVFAAEGNAEQLAEVVNVLIARFADPEPGVRREALRAAGMIRPHPPEAVLEPALAALDDPEPEVRETAFWLVGEVRPVRASTVARILEVVRTHPQAQVYAGRALGVLAETSPRVVELLLAELGRGSAEHRSAVMFALGTSGAAAATEPLRRIAENEAERPLVRANAELALKQLEWSRQRRDQDRRLADRRRGNG